LTPLNDIPDQDIAIRILVNSFNRNRLASTYLFYGPDGVGKWSAALALASLVNCLSPIKDESGKVVDACGECLHCRQVKNGTFPELHFAVPIPPHKSESEAVGLTLEFIEQKKGEPYRIISSARQLTIPVATARAIKRSVAIKPAKDLKRFILFYQMERMLPASADSLLKLIEEPPPETIIILTARTPESLLPTIQSRAQKISFRSIPEDLIAEYITAKYKIPEEKARFAARLAEGSAGRALEYLEEKDDASLRQISFLIFKALFLKDSAALLSAINEMVNPRDRGEAEQILAQWQSYLADLICLKFGGESAAVINADLVSELESISVHIPSEATFSRLKESIRDSQKSLRRNVHIKPAMMALALDLKDYINQSA